MTEAENLANRMGRSEEDAIRCVQRIFKVASKPCAHGNAEGAMITAGLLLEDLVGWAIAWRIGTMALEAAPDIANHFGTPNDIGRAVMDGVMLGIPSNVSRAITSDILRKIFPKNNYINDLAEDIVALNHGEVHTMLTPEPTGQHGAGYTLAKYRLEAVKFVVLHATRGTKKGVARNKVSECFNCSIDTLISWEKRLPQILGALRVKEELDLIKSYSNVGSLKSSDKIFDDDTTRLCFEFINSAYSDERMKKLGRDYNALLRKTKENGKLPAILVQA